MANAASSIIRPTAPVFDVDGYVKAVHDKLGHALDDFQVLWGQLLVAKFVREKIGSLYTAPKRQTEDLYQGKCGLVLKLGPMAFKDDETTKFHNQKVNVGDWVVFRTSDGTDVDITPLGASTGIPCRLLEQESQVRMIVQRPDLVY